MEKNIPTKDELKLIIDNALLEQEKRITASLNESITTQNKTYMDHILTLNTRVTKLESAIKNVKSVAATFAAAASVVSGLLGFFIAQLTK